jgi:succinyl-diaminopimelate desuccinylase
MNNVVQDTCDLIRIRTDNPPGDEEAAADWVADRARNIGMKVGLTRIAPGRANCVAELELGAGPALMLCTHLDVVPASPDAWEPDVRDGRLYGRGACDAKGALAAMLSAAEQIANSPQGAVGRLIVAAVCDEEVGASGARHLAATGLGVDCVIIGEPTDNQLVLRSSGVLRARLTFTGLAGHASQPSSGVSAIRAAAQVILAADEYHRELQSSGRGTCIATMVAGGTGVNVVPDQCSVVLDRRVAPGHADSSIAEAERELEERVARWITDPRVGCTRSAAGVSVDTLNTSADSPMALRLLAALAQVAPGPVFPAVTDAPHFAERGTPTFILGPGSIGQAHTAQEWVEIAELERAVTLYDRAARAILTSNRAKPFTVGPTS